MSCELSQVIVAKIPERLEEISTDGAALLSPVIFLIKLQ